jgi:hypothetical protein
MAKQPPRQLGKPARKRTTPRAPSFLDSVANAAKPLRAMMDGERAPSLTREERQALFEARENEKEQRDLVYNARNHALWERRQSLSERWPKEGAQLRETPLIGRETSLFSDAQAFVESKKPSRALSATGIAQAKECAGELNFQCGMIFLADGYWPALRSDPAFLFYFLRDVLRLLYVLSPEERIRTLSTVFARIADLHGAGTVVLSSEEINGVGAVLLQAFSLAKISGNPDFDALAEYVSQATSGTRATELWRSIDDKETARAYFERVIAPIPFRLRPTTTEISTGQPQLYKSLSVLCAEQRRSNKVGDTELAQATAISQLFPAGVAKERKQRRAPK